MKDWKLLQTVQNETQLKLYLAKKREEAKNKQPLFEELREKLLSIGGEDVLSYSDEPGTMEWNWQDYSLQYLLSKGIHRQPNTVEFTEMPLGKCHTNSSRLYLKGYGKIETGWALTFGVWQKHSWVLNIQKRILETTIPATDYFGYTLKSKESAWFVRNTIGSLTDPSNLLLLLTSRKRTEIQKHLQGKSPWGQTL